VWKLLDVAYESFGVIPTLLERDVHIPPLPELVAELDNIREIQGRHATTGDARHVHFA
jgi:hypothetical protein